MVRPARVATKIRELTQVEPVAQYLVNRNPRNLERLRIAYKPSGYHLEKPGKCYWHKLDLSSSGRYVYAKLLHYQNGPVITASTNEWAIKKYLYTTRSTSAYVNLARVFSQRCLEAGLTEFVCDIDTVKESKVEKFLDILKENGLSLSEPEIFTPHRPWNVDRPEKPWEVTE